MLSRRSFVRYTSFATAGLLGIPAAMANYAKSKPLVGMQLYCVRDDMKKDPAGTLRRLADMGYRHVEHANYIGGKFYGYTPADFKKLLSDLGLSMPSGHTVLAPRHYKLADKSFTDEWKKTVEDAALLGQKFVISPSMDNAVRHSYDALKQLLEMFNKSGELCKQYNMQFGYHNHDFEFSESLNGKSLYEIILAETDPALVMQQLDTGNLVNGGANALQIVQKHPGRFASLHVKDAIATKGGSEPYESTVLGKGIVDLKTILKTVSKEIETPHFIIEQEAYQGIAPLDCMQQNLAVMKKWGYK
ncbi:MAG TPA: sugar phosphate isomerase/epimerase family protein [Phnomibacter sp.]|nr:sugar phosphate isomerase/epimerase family protein [Phnomibacter sp.]